MYYKYCIDKIVGREYKKFMSERKIWKEREKGSMRNRRKGCGLLLLLILTVFFAARIPAAVNAAETEGTQVQEQPGQEERHTGWAEENGRRFYYLADGSKASGMKVIDGKTYYFSEKGVMQTGWKKINGKFRYFDPKNGVMCTGFRKIGQKRYYFQENGVRCTGFRKIGQKRYYFQENGVMCTGFKKIGQKRYYFRENGVLKTGWIKVGEERYYAGEAGVIRTGWQNIDGKRYFFSLNRGVMRTDFWKIDQKKYYLGENGILQTGGWLTVDGKKYYAGTDGALWTGLQKIDGKTYCFDGNGALQIGWAVNGADKYYTDASGVIQTGWQEIAGSEYYFDAAGKMYTGSKTIDGMEYLFDPETGKLDTEKTPRETRLERLCRQIVESQVKKTDSVNTKLSKLFQYVTWKHSYLRSYSFTGASGWHKTYAYNMLTSKRGNCYSYAAAFAYLAKKATDLPVRVGWGGTPARAGGLTPHGWCEIRINGVWYVFDPDLYRYVYYGSCYYKTMGQVGGYYYNRHYATVDF